MKGLRNMRRSLVIRVLGVALFLGAVLSDPKDALAQCSLCRDAVAASSSETREAMNYAIIGLALTPYGVAAIAAWTLSPSMRASLRRRLSALMLRGPGAPR
jgi:threonine/homoserine/homoserine lactone efflux protein